MISPSTGIQTATCMEIWREKIGLYVYNMLLRPISVMVCCHWVYSNYYFGKSTYIASWNSWDVSHCHIAGVKSTMFSSLCDEYLPMLSSKHAQNNLSWWIPGYVSIPLSHVCRYWYTKYVFIMLCKVIARVNICKIIVICRLDRYIHLLSGVMIDNDQ